MFASFESWADTSLSRPDGVSQVKRVQHMIAACQLRGDVFATLFHSS